MGKNVIVVGGGIAGLTAAIYLARGGKKVTLFEKERSLGGRSTTSLRAGFRFNLGPHIVYRRGAAAQVYRELGIPVRGGRPRLSATALLAGDGYKLPISAMSLALTGILGPKAKIDFASLMLRLRSIDPKALEGMTIRQWLDANVSDSRLRLVLESLLRFATYSCDLEQSASVALEQLRLAMRGTVFVDEGWQKIVDALHSSAVSAGVNFVTSSRVIGVIHDDRVRAIEIGGLNDEPKGTRLPAETVVLALDPATARSLVGDGEFARSWGDLKPVTAACLDVALSKLPNPKRRFAVAVDRPLHLAVHSAFAQLAPHGGALVHAMKYAAAPDASDEHDLEVLLDEAQPGWRDVVVHRRFLPDAKVSNALITPAVPRPSPVTPVRGLYLAGDWVAAEGALADAALSSARTAAKAILSSESPDARG